MAGNFQELLKKAEEEKRAKNMLDEPENETVQPELTASTDAPLDQQPENEQPVEMPEVETEREEDVPSARHAKPKSKEDSKRFGCARGLFLFALIVALCGTLAYIVVAGALDFIALNKSDSKVDVVIPSGSSTAEIASILEENDLIDQPLVFRLYSRVSGKDGSYQAGTYSLSADMGYTQIMAVIIAGNPRETVDVVIPEGYKITQIAALLEEKGVCTSADFYDALINETYDYDFFDSIPQASDGGVYEGRIYRLEGYLFPDTYNFYTESSGKTVINKMLANFDSKITVAMKSAMQSQGLTLDDVVIMASITQREAASDKEMPKVTRVLYNRLQSSYTRLECDSTALYVEDLMPNTQNLAIISNAYNTYKRSGLTAGAICNPGLKAIEAAIYPSEDETIRQCYYFANDTAGNTYYSKTFAQHEAICRRYRIGAYG